VNTDLPATDWKSDACGAVPGAESCGETGAGIGAEKLAENSDMVKLPRKNAVLRRSPV
jgi:hypothetical protein